jgi:hypothetical protein
MKNNFPKLKVVFDKSHRIGIVVSRKSVERLYDGLGLSQFVLDKVFDAHVEVLKFGLRTHREKIIAIDCVTGNIEAEATGASDCVSWSFKDTYGGTAVTVHNHPESTSFSYLDLYDFGHNNMTPCISTQGHNGTMYSVRKTDRFDASKMKTKNELLLVLLGIVATNKEKTDITASEIFVQTIADAFGWLFVKEGR